MLKYFERYNGPIPRIQSFLDTAILIPFLQSHRCLFSAASHRTIPTLACYGCLSIRIVIQLHHHHHHKISTAPFVDLLCFSNEYWCPEWWSKRRPCTLVQTNLVGAASPDCCLCFPLMTFEHDMYLSPQHL